MYDEQKYLGKEELLNQKPQYLYFILFNMGINH